MTKAQKVNVEEPKLWFETIVYICAQLYREKEYLNNYTLRQVHAQDDKEVADIEQIE